MSYFTEKCSTLHLVSDFKSRKLTAFLGKSKLASKTSFIAFEDNFA